MMSQVEATAPLPKSVQRYLNKAAISISDCVLLSFDEQWNYLGAHGDLARFALAQCSAEELSELFRALCIGLPRLKGAELKAVGLPNNRSVDLHLFAGPNAVHILLLDVRDHVEQTRVWQQSAQETELKSYEKTRQLRQHRATGAELKKQLTELRLALEIERAKRSQLQHELYALQRGCSARGESFALETLARLFDRQKGLNGISGSTKHSLAELASRLGHALATLMTVNVLGPADRSFAIDIENCVSALLPALMFAHRRASVQTPLLLAELSCDGTAVRMQLTAGASDLSELEAKVLWQRDLPERELTPAESALLLVAERLRDVYGRVTKSFSAEQGLRLTISLPIAAPPSHAVVTKVAPSVRVRRVWAIALNPSRTELLQTAVANSGVEIFSFATPADAPQLSADSEPAALLLDLTQSGSSQYAYSAKAAGFNGQIIGLGQAKLSAAVKAAFAEILAEPTAEQLRGVLLGS